MGENYFMISDAAKKVNVENHVLRYWEEELHLPIERNELGHRHYSKNDIERFIRIKQLKEQGIQLKAIRNMLDKMDKPIEEARIHIFAQEGGAVENASIYQMHAVDDSSKGDIHTLSPSLVVGNTEAADVNKNDKAMRLQFLMKQMICEAMTESGKEIAETIKESVLKELDYQFRIQEEKEEVREAARCKREEEHYRKLDEVLREKTKKEKRKKHSFF